MRRVPALLTLILAGCSIPTTPKIHTVTYRVSVAGRDALTGGIDTHSMVDITIENESGGTEQKQVYAPWESVMKLRTGQRAYLSARNPREYWTVKAEILMDGAIVKTAEANAHYGSATIGGIVP